MKFFDTQFGKILILWAKGVLTLILNSIFIVIWAALQYGVNNVINFLKKQGDLNEMQIAFFFLIRLAIAIASFLPILKFLIRDFKIIITRSPEEVEEELSNPKEELE